VLPAVVVEAEPADDNHEPRGELPPSVSREGSQAAAALLSQVFYDEGIAIHDHVMIAGSLPGYVEDQAGVGLEKPSPGAFLLGTFVRFEKLAELAWERTGGLGVELLAHGWAAPGGIDST
jgi:hypothetical protein